MVRTGGPRLPDLCVRLGLGEALDDTDPFDLRRLERGDENDAVVGRSSWGRSLNESCPWKGLRDSADDDDECTDSDTDVV